MTAERPPDEAPGDGAGLLTIDLAALAANWRRLAAEAGGAECAAVVKADAYGVGLARAAPALARAGARTFFVAHLAEGRRLRAALPEAVIYVLNGLPPGAAPAFAAQNLRPVLGSPDEVAEWAGFARERSRASPAALHVDTGMNRLGLRPDEAGALAAAGPPGFEVALVMSHLVAAEEPAHPLNARQVAAMRALGGLFPGAPRSLANSSGLFLPARPHFDLVRPGYALYGGNPVPGRPNPMRDVVRLEAPVVQVRRVEDGETVGYGGRWTARGRRRVAILALGYADGLFRAASGTDAAAGAEAVVAGRRCPVAGRVSMDLVALDVTALPEGTVRRGDRATILGQGIGVDDLGLRAGTIGYEVLTNLGKRFSRAYLSG